MASRVVSRLLSTAVKGKASAHAPPKKIYGTVGRYAEAVFTAASKANLQDKVASELGAFKETMRKSPNFASFLANPSSKFTELDIFTGFGFLRPFGDLTDSRPHPTLPRLVSIPRLVQFLAARR